MIERPWTIAEVSERTGVPQATLRWYAHKGTGGPKSFKLNGRRLYRPSDVEAWLEEAYAGGAA